VRARSCPAPALALALVLILAAPGLRATALGAPGGMATDVLDSFTKSPASRQDQNRSTRSTRSGQTGPVAPAQPKPPVVPGAPPQNAQDAAGPFPPRQTPPGQATTNPASGAPPRQQLLTLHLDGSDRQAVLVLPKAPPRKQGQPAPKLPLLVFLHGAGGSASQAMRQTGLAERAAAAGFLAVFPEGLGPADGEGSGQTWNAWNCCGYARDQHVDDVGFLSALITRLRGDYGADPRRIYLAGFSNGAMLASRFALERPGVAAALASVAGSLPCDAARPDGQLPVLVIHGSRDAVARFAPTPAHPATGRFCEDHPARAQVDFWVRGLGLGPKPQVRDSTASPVRVEDYGPARRGARGFVRFVIVKGGGHAWPGGARQRFRYCDMPVTGLDATGLVLDFFLRPPSLAPAPEKAKPAAPAKKKSRPVR